MSFRAASKRLLTPARSRPTTSTPAIQRLSAVRAHLAHSSSFAQYREKVTQEMEIPKKMYGVQINATGGPEVLEYKEGLDVPAPGEGEILVKNEFTGINYIDT
jgi:NADPH2:quinone reductase